MSDYLQEVKQVILDDMFRQGIVDANSNIINETKYADYLRRESDRIQTQINNHQEPGGYHINMLYKDLDVVHEMLDAIEPGRPSHEEMIIEKYTEKQNKRKEKIQKWKDGATRAVKLFGFQRHVSQHPERGK